VSATSEIKTRDGFALNLHDWSIEKPRIQVALLHGYGEHAGRYAHVAKAWNEMGISVLAVDLRGHGRSSGVRGHIERFSDYHLDADALIAAVRAKSPAPVALFGHSVGGLIALDWLIANRGARIAATALSSPFLGVALKVSPVKTAVGRAMSRFVPKLSMSSGLTGKDVARDAEIARLYDTDPLNNKNATVRWYTEAMEAVDRVMARAGEIETPMLVLYGGADKVADSDKTDQLVRSLKMAERSYERLPDHYHEIVNEPPDVRAKVIARFASWLIERKEAQAA
jgi:lysophospholipase